MFLLQERQHLLSSLYKKPVHNAVRCFSCFYYFYFVFTIPTVHTSKQGNSNIFLISPQKHVL